MYYLEILILLKECLEYGPIHTGTNNLLILITAPCGLSQDGGNSFVNVYTTQKLFKRVLVAGVFLIAQIFYRHK